MVVLEPSRVLEGCNCFLNFTIHVWFYIIYIYPIPSLVWQNHILGDKSTFLESESSNHIHIFAQNQGYKRKFVWQQNQFSYRNQTYVQSKTVRLGVSIIARGPLRLNLDPFWQDLKFVLTSYKFIIDLRTFIISRTLV